MPVLLTYSVLNWFWSIVFSEVDTDIYLLILSLNVMVYTIFCVKLIRCLYIYLSISCVPISPSLITPICCHILLPTTYNILLECIYTCCFELVCLLDYVCIYCWLCLCHYVILTLY